MKIKYDVTESDPDSARAKGDFTEIKPGLYKMEIIAASEGNSKTNGQPDETKPRMEVTFKNLDNPSKGAQVWGYFVLPGHPSWNKGAAEKLDQLLLATSITDGKKKRKGEFDTEKDLKGKIVVVKVNNENRDDGTPRGVFGAVFPPDHSTGRPADTAAPADDQLIDGDDDVLDDDVIADDVEPEPEAPAFDAEARKGELKGADVADLKALAKGYELITTGISKKSELVDAILAHELSLVESDIADDDDVILDDAEADVPPTTALLTKEQLQALERDALVKVAKDFDLVIKGKKVGEVIDMILAAQGGPGDDEPF